LHSLSIKKPKNQTTNILAKSLWIRNLLTLLRTSTLAVKLDLSNITQPRGGELVIESFTDFK